MKKTVPRSERSIFSSRVEALGADSTALPVEPAADTNVMKVTDTILFLRPAYASLYGGRRSMSWWATILLYIMLVFFAVFSYPGFSYAKNTGFLGNYLDFWLENVDGLVGIPAFIFICCFWMFIPWRRQLPIILNRRMQKVACTIEGKLVTCEWKLIDAYIKDVSTIAVGGAPINEGVLTLVFPGHGGKGNSRPRAVIKATEDAPAAIINGGFYGAGMIWEYIRIYMQEGADAVPSPAPEARYIGKNIINCINYMNPWMPFTYRVWWQLLIALILSPIFVPFLSCVLAGHITYMLFDRILPRRKWPQELIDACDGIWDGRE